MFSKNPRTVALVSTAAALVCAAPAATAAATATEPATSGAPAVRSDLATPPKIPASVTDDPFWTYDGDRPLASYEPGEVLKSRTLNYHVFGLPTPVKAVQLLYRTVDAQGRPSANVTSVLRSSRSDGTKAVSFQSFYDSLNPDDSPSRAIAGDFRLPGLLTHSDAATALPLLMKGYDVVVPDIEGPRAELLAGSAYGSTTLDSLRAASAASGETGITDRTRFALAGYSGGAFGTTWAASMAPKYAPEINSRIVGFTVGGAITSPANMLKYAEGSTVWSGMLAPGLVGSDRVYGLDIRSVLNSEGRRMYDASRNVSLLSALGKYPGLTWEKIAEPEYRDPNSVPGMAALMNRNNVGLAPAPTVPGQFMHGTGGWMEGSPGERRGLSAGDGPVSAGDSRALAGKYCDAGNRSISYQQHPLSHVPGYMLWTANALPWIDDRFAGKTPQSDCGRIPQGNSLAPEVATEPAKVSNGS